MLRFAVRAERTWFDVPYAVRLLAVVLAVVVLIVLSVGPALAANHTDPFRWQ